MRFRYVAVLVLTLATLPVLLLPNSAGAEGPRISQHDAYFMANKIVRRNEYLHDADGYVASCHRDAPWQFFCKLRYVGYDGYEDCRTIIRVFSKYDGYLYTRFYSTTC